MQQRNVLQQREQHILAFHHLRSAATSRLSRQVGPVQHCILAWPLPTCPVYMSRSAMACEAWQPAGHADCMRRMNCAFSPIVFSGPLYLAGDDEHKGAAAMALDVGRCVAEVAHEIRKSLRSRCQQLAAIGMHPWAAAAAVAPPAAATTAAAMPARITTRWRAGITQVCNSNGEHPCNEMLRAQSTLQRSWQQGSAFKALGMQGPGGRLLGARATGSRCVPHAHGLCQRLIANAQHR